MKVLVCGGRDYYEFYTQSDAEAVIENLKNNIAAKDKLIQSLIDFDSEEVKRLEADNKRLREEIAGLHDYLTDKSNQVIELQKELSSLKSNIKRLRDALESIAD